MNQWTKRGEVTAADQEVITAVLRREPKTAQIFVTGEVDRERLGQSAEDVLAASNEMTGEPLFVLTKVQTVRMPRFDTKKVWPCLDDNLLDEVIGNEAKRLNVPDLKIDDWDFCLSFVKFVREEYGMLQTPVTKVRNFEHFYQTMYLSALLLLDKCGYMTVPVCQHFAIKETEEFFKSMDTRLRPLTQVEINELHVLRDTCGGLDGLTNRELRFLTGLYDRGFEA
jgi:hypothetical protein